ncbi:MAG: hypothetical protein MUD17_11125 [Gemmatimonadaceae bacterium]|nr:hypothetical protein [Gemmatimonadaceae bacterium]
MARLVAAWPALVLVLGACRTSAVTTAPPPTSARDQGALQQERGLSALQTDALGVPPFAWNGNDPRLNALGYAMADLLITDLARSRALQLVERARLGEILTELDLAGTGRVDSSSAPRVGKLIQARRLILGTVDTLPSGEFRLSVRVADVQTGAIAQALDARAAPGELLAAEKVTSARRSTRSDRRQVSRRSLRTAKACRPSLRAMCVARSPRTRMRRCSRQSSRSRASAPVRCAPSWRERPVALTGCSAHQRGGCGCRGPTQSAARSVHNVHATALRSG